VTLYPFSFRLGHVDVQVFPMSDDMGALGNAFGCFIPERQVIYVQATLPPAEQARILIHEILHACWYSARGPETASEERACETLDMPIASILRNNPGIAEILIDGLINNLSIFSGHHRDLPDAQTSDGATIH
jgi:hypothetical protein